MHWKPEITIKPNYTTMIKRLFATFCAAAVFAVSSAQMNSGGFRLDNRSVYYGLRMGFTSSHLGGDFDTDAKTGLNLGMVVGLRCSPYIPMFLESGIYYTERGGKEGGLSTPLGRASIKYNLGYIEVPVLMKYGIGIADEFAILPYVGPNFAVGVGGQTKETHPGETAIKYDSFGSDKFNRFDVGIKLGCGFEWNMVYAEVGYNWGITNISDFRDDSETFNRAFYMNIGINF